MSFKVYSTDDGRVMALEYKEASAFQPSVGMALSVNASGQLAKCAATSVPTYISAVEAGATLATGTLIPVLRVQPDIIFETQNSAAFTSVKVGQKVTIDADGLRVTATTTSGVAEVVHMEDTAVGSEIRVRFNAAAGA